MKLIFWGLLTVLFFSSTFGQTHSKKNKNAPPSLPSDRKSGNEEVSVTIYEDGKKQSVMTFVNGFLIREETDYEIDNRKIKDVTKYSYTKTGKINETEEWKNGKKISRQDRDYDFDVNLVAQYLYSADLLKKKGIIIPLPGLIFSQLKDTATIFEIADKQDDFKKEISSNGDFKTIKFTAFNKNIRFDPTLLEINMDQTITDYELTLKNGYLFKEVYKTGASELKKISSAEIMREYSYKENRRMKLVTTLNLISKDGKPYNTVTELKFVYTN